MFLYIVLGVIGFYLVWLTDNYYTYLATNFLKIETFQRYRFFISLVVSLVMALLLARLAWSITNWSYLNDLGWSIIPYYQSEGKFLFFNTMPWLIFRIDKELNYLVFMITILGIFPFLYRGLFQSMLSKMEKSKRSFQYFVIWEFLLIVFLITAFIIKDYILILVGLGLCLFYFVPWLRSFFYLGYSVVVVAGVHRILSFRGEFSAINFVVYLVYLTIAAGLGYLLSRALDYLNKLYEGRFNQ